VAVGQVLGDILFRIVSGDAAFGEFVTESEPAQLGKFRHLAEAEDFPVVERRPTRPPSRRGSFELSQTLSAPAKTLLIFLALRPDPNQSFPQ